MDVGLWIVSILGAGLFLMAGGYQLADGMQAQFDAWGLPPGLDGGLGILELLGGIGLLFKRTAGWSAVGLMVIMLGAVWTYLTHGQMLMAALSAGVFVVLGLIAWGRGLPIRTKEQQLARARRGPHPSPAS